MYLRKCSDNPCCVSWFRVHNSSPGGEKILTLTRDTGLHSQLRLGGGSCVTLTECPVSTQNTDIKDRRIIPCPELADTSNNEHFWVFLYFKTMNSLCNLTTHSHFSFTFYESFIYSFSLIIKVHPSI